MASTFEGTELPDILDSRALERLTGTKASTWRYWASIGTGPASFKMGGVACGGSQPCWRGSPSKRQPHA